MSLNCWQEPINVAQFNQRQKLYNASKKLLYDRSLIEKTTDPLFPVVDEELAPARVDDVAVLLAEGLVNVFYLWQIFKTFYRSKLLLFVMG